MQAFDLNTLFAILNTKFLFIYFIFSAYALAKLGIDARTFIEALNSKLGTMRRAIKLQRADGPDSTTSAQ